MSTPEASQEKKKDPTTLMPSAATAIAFILVFLAAEPTGAQDTARPAGPRFTDVTADCGISFAFTSGRMPAQQILEVNGNGLGLIDYDNDGDLDLFVANGATLADTEHGPGCRLFENIGGLKFKDVTAEARLDVHRWANGVAVADFDGDGFDDVFIACFGADVLLRNDRKGHFEDVTAKAGVGDKRWGTSAAWGDVDGDGDLDLYVANYLVFDPQRPPAPAAFKGVAVMGGPHGLTPQADILWENQGDGTFKDVTAVSGCLNPMTSFGLNVIMLDFDRDGKTDIVVANDSMPGFYFHNLGVSEGHAKFEEIGAISGMASNTDGSNQAAMGLAVADVDGNGFPDKFTSVFSSDTNAMHMNTDGRLFEDCAQRYGLAMISRPYLGWSAGFFDFDLDGDEDLFIVDGHVYPQATMESMDSEYAQTPLLFERGPKRFTRVTPEKGGAWLAEKRHGRNAVFADLDGDGDIDIVTGDLNGPIRVLRNDALGPESPSGDRSWLIVDLRDERPNSKNRRGIGSVVELAADGAKQTRWIFSGGGFQSSPAMMAHFGLPVGAKEIAVTVVWPDGVKQAINHVSPRQRLTIKREEPK